jgi:hypothetical protein
MKKFKTKVLATVGLVAVAGLFTLCKAHGSGGDYQGAGQAPGQVKVWQVVFDADGGVPPPDPRTVADGETIGELPPEPEKESSDFGGWYLDLDGEQFDPLTPVTGDILLLAKWDAPPAPGYVRVTFYGGLGSPGITNRDVPAGGTVATLPGVTRAGHTFDRWWTKDGSGNDWGNEFTSATPVAAAMTVYARWTPVTYTIAYYDADSASSTRAYSGNTAGTPPLPAGAPATHTYGATTALPDGVRAFWRFDGWHKEAAATNRVYSLYAAGAYSEPVSLYAKWTEYVTLTYHANGAPAGNVPDPLKGAPGTTVAVSGNTGGLAKDGYSFAGWNTADDGTGVQYPAGADYVLNANGNLYARWLQSALSTLYVTESGTGDGSSWANASGDLQAMINLAANYPLIYGSPIPEVWVAGGTYKPQSSALGVANAGRDNSFRLRSGVKIYGGFAGDETAIDQRSFTPPPADTATNPNQWGALAAAHETILSGDIGTPGNASDNAYNVVVAAGIPGDAEIVLDGLTISGGNADTAGNYGLDGGTINKNYGGGMYLVGVSPRLTNVSIKDNKSTLYGGGIYVNTGSPLLTNVSITNNHILSVGLAYGGGMYVVYGSAELKNVIIANNTATTSGSSSAYGGGMFVSSTSSSPVLTNVIIAGNTATGGSTASYGGGIHFANCDAVLTNVAIKGNALNGASTVYGGGMSISNANTTYNNGNVVLTNVALTGNVLSSGADKTIYGGGLYLAGTYLTLTMTNCTVAGNWSASSTASTYGGGGIYAGVPASKITIRNSIVWGNTVGAGEAAKNEWMTTNAQVFEYSVVGGKTAADLGAAGNNKAGDTIGTPFALPDYATSDTAKTGGDYRLNTTGGAGATLINGGYNFFTAGPPDLTAVITDLDGTARFKGGVYDLGAWEKQ